MKLLTRREVIPFLQERFRDKCLIWHSNPGVFKTCYSIFPCDCGFIASKEEEQEDNGHILNPSWDTLAVWSWAHHLSISLLVSFVERKGAGIKSRPGLPRWCHGKESACQCRRRKRHRFNPSVGKIPWSREWQPTPVFLPEKSHIQRSLAGYSPWGCKESATTHTLKSTPT